MQSRTLRAQGKVGTLCVQSDRSVFFVGGDGFVTRYANLEPTHSAKHNSFFRSLQLNEAKGILYLGDAHGQIAIYESGTLEFTKMIMAHEMFVNCLLFLNSFDLMISGSDDFSIGIWKGEKMTRLSYLRSHSGGVKALVCSGDEQYFFSGSIDKTVIMWSSIDFSLLSKFACEEMIFSLLMWPTQSHLLFGGQGTVFFYRITGTKMVKKYKDLHDDWIRQMIFLPNTVAFVTGSNDSEVHLNWYSEEPLLSHESPVVGLGVVGENLLVSVSLDGLIVISEFDQEKAQRTWEDLGRAKFPEKNGKLLKARCEMKLNSDSVGESRDSKPAKKSQLGI